ncbi:MAG: hypothetical protein ORN85_07000 [Sediminibacterium sp.]|nr:hypothetical protein [Sediminibacterium sp.]
MKNIYLIIRFIMLVMIVFLTQETRSQSVKSKPNDSTKIQQIKKNYNHIPPRFMIALSYQIPFNSVGITFGQLSNAYNQSKPQRISGFGAFHYNFFNKNINNSPDALSGSILKSGQDMFYFDFTGGITIHLKGPHWLFTGLGYGQYITYDERENNGEIYYTKSTIESESEQGLTTVLGYIVDFSGVNLKFGIKNLSNATLFNVGVGYTFKSKKYAANKN